jgi:PAS domain S-box-containing protein
MQSAGQILIVDDQLSAREVLRGLLSGKGYQLVFAGSGQEALVKAAEQLPDLVLLDVMMPGMDGFEVCQRLRNDPTLAEVPIIMVTSLDDQETRLKGLELGVDDFLSKPFNPTELQVRVQTITRLNRQRRLHLLELQAERDRTRAILEALGEAVIVTNGAGIIEYINPAAVTLTGFSLSEAVGQNWRLWQNGESGAQCYEEILAVVQQGQTWRGEMVHQRQDGTLYDAAMTVAPLAELNQPGQPSGFVSVQRDITPLKKAEQAKDEFVSNVSHELRTPLSILTLVSDNLDLLFDRLDEQKRRKMIRDIQKQTHILNELIGDILEVSRLDSGRVSMEREALNLNELVEQDIKEILPLAQQKQQSVSLGETEQLKVWGHKVQLKQVIRNLLNNAIKYTPEGGQIYCECQRLSVPSALANPTLETAWPGLAHLPYQTWAALRVMDTGIGISPENLPHIFERFYRVKTQDNVRGTGLGLSIVRKLIELHDGQVAASSIPGQGSIFAIYLPLLE